MSSAGGPMAVTASMEYIARLLRRQQVKPADEALLALVFAEKPTQAQLDETLAVCDIEVMGAHKSLMLSYLLHEHPELTPSPYAGPRLKGLVSYFRFKNLETLAHFSKIGRVLNEAGLTPLIFKGAAMKFLRPGLSRPMGDVDILVPAARFDEAVKLCRKLGYTGRRVSHAINLMTPEGRYTVDIHHSFFPGRGMPPAFQQGLWARASRKQAFGVDVWLPSYEDLFFLVLVNLTRNLREKSSLAGLFYALFDCRFLFHAKAGFDWGLVRANAGLTGMEIEVRLAAEFIKALVPSLLPDLEAHLPLTRKVRNFFNQCVFDERFLAPKLKACRALLAVDVKNYPSRYVPLILKGLALKKLRQIPPFVRWYLKKRGVAHAG